MPVLLILVSVVILVGVVGVAIGRGGEMAEFAGDYPPVEADDLVTAADVALLHPPSALWGYNVAATDEALSRVAQVVTNRDVEIAALRRQLAELRADTSSAAASADPGAADTASSAAGPAPVDPAPAVRARIDRASADRALIERAAAQRASAGPASADTGTGTGPGD